ncbi:MAG: hypothetical protein ABSE56_02505 [Bryobacteraceae bacterium]|jgi:regulation of enolase protein 1 (concanavalin A-like superfamily)
MPPPANLGLLLSQIQLPGLTYVESDIAKAWLNAHGAEYDQIDFNVRLGEGTDPGEEYTQEVRNMSVLITQKRADIVARIGGQADIIEVKVRVAFGALGQLLGYRTLWRIAHPELPVRSLIAIGRAVVPDCQPVIDESGIVVQIYPRPG